LDSVVSGWQSDGRSIAHADLGPDIVTITCDHADDLAIAEVFRRTNLNRTG
jgi:hypothetical protein